MSNVQLVDECREVLRKRNDHGSKFFGATNVGRRSGFEEATYKYGGNDEAPFSERRRGRKL